MRVEEEVGEPETFFRGASFMDTGEIKHVQQMVITGE